MPRRFVALAVHSRPEALGELVELLSSSELEVETAKSAIEALHRISTRPYSLIIAAHKPPILDGVELLERSAAVLPDAWRVVMVSNPAHAAELDARPDRGRNIVRFVGRPDERSRLVALVHEGLALLQLVEQQRQLVHKLGGEYERLQRREKLLDVVVKERTKELEESYERLKTANRQALFGLAEAIEAKDPYTKGHCGRVAAYALVLAQESGYPDDGLEELEFGSFLHDIGKIGVRDSVLQKPGPLDEDEWKHMREHPVKGYEIASQIEMLHPIMPAVRNHHERWDGNGYPDRMRGEEIPMSARLVAIADAYDAMATDRPYKRALALEECEALLKKNAGKMFDPELVEVFCARHLGALYREDYDGVPVPYEPETAGEDEAGGASSGVPVSYEPETAGEDEAGGASDGRVAFAGEDEAGGASDGRVAVAGEDEAGGANGGRVALAGDGGDGAAAPVSMYPETLGASGAFRAVNPSTSADSGRLPVRRGGAESAGDEPRGRDPASGRGADRS